MKRVAILTSFLPNPQSFEADKSVADLYRYCGENSGNIAFVYAIQKQIKNPVQFFSWQFSPAQIREKADIIVIPCANQLGSHCNMGWAAEPIEKAGLPVVAIGLGAQAHNSDVQIEMPEGTKKWLEVIGKHKTGLHNITTRGTYSQSQAETAGAHSLALGCPSLFISKNPLLGQEIERNWKSAPKRVCVPGGHYKWPHMMRAEQQLIELVHHARYQGAYICQSTIENLRLSKNEFDLIPAEDLEKIRAYMLPYLSLEEFKEWCSTYAYSFYDAEAWMAFSKRFDVTIGARYHAAALSMQAGVMGVTIAIDSRTEELCKTTFVPYFRVADIDWSLSRDNIYKKVQFSAASFDKNRQFLCGRYVDFLKSNELVPSDKLIDISKHQL